MAQTNRSSAKSGSEQGIFHIEMGEGVNPLTEGTDKVNMTKFFSRTTANPE